MPKFDVVDEMVIDAPVLAVFAAVLDEYSGVTHFWLPDLEFKPRDGARMDRVGAVCDTTTRSHGMKGCFCEKIVGFKTGELIDFELSGDLRGTEKWTFEPLEGGKTKARMTLKGESNKLVLSLLSPFVNLETELHKPRKRFLGTLNKELSKK